MDTLKKVVFLGFGILVSTQNFVDAMESSAGSSASQEAVVAADDGDGELPHKRALEDDDELADGSAGRPCAKAPRVVGDGGDVHTISPAVGKMKTSAGLVVRTGRVLMWPFEQMRIFVAAHWPQSAVNSAPQMVTVPYSSKDYERARAGDKNLVGANLMGANLSGVDLSGADLTDANLIGAILEETKFDNNSKLIRTKLMGANLTATNLSFVTMDGVDASGAVFDRTIFMKTKIIHSTFKKAVFRDFVFDTVTFDYFDCGLSYFANVSFLNCQLFQVAMKFLKLAVNIIFNNTLLLEVSFSDSSLSQAVFMNNNYLGFGVDFSRARLDHCSFIGKTTMDTSERRIPELRCLEKSGFEKLYESTVGLPSHFLRKIVPDGTFTLDSQYINCLMVGTTWHATTLTLCSFSDIVFKVSAFSEIANAEGSVFHTVLFGAKTTIIGEESINRLLDLRAMVNGDYRYATRSFWKENEKNIGRQITEGVATSLAVKVGVAVLGLA